MNWLTALVAFDKELINEIFKSNCGHKGQSNVQN